MNFPNLFNGDLDQWFSKWSPLTPGELSRLFQEVQGAETIFTTILLFIFSLCGHLHSWCKSSDGRDWAHPGAPGQQPHTRLGTPSSTGTAAPHSTGHTQQHRDSSPRLVTPSSTGTAAPHSTGHTQQHRDSSPKPATPSSIGTAARNRSHPAAWGQQPELVTPSSIRTAARNRSHPAASGQQRCAVHLSRVLDT